MTCPAWKKTQEQVKESDPRQQGLKHRVPAVPRLPGHDVKESDPRQQGLKLRGSQSGANGYLSQRVRSTTTRIETSRASCVAMERLNGQRVRSTTTRIETPAMRYSRTGKPVNSQRVRSTTTRIETSSPRRCRPRPRGCQRVRSTTTRIETGRRGRKFR